MAMLPSFDHVLVPFQLLAPTQLRALRIPYACASKMGAYEHALIWVNQLDELLDAMDLTRNDIYLLPCSDASVKLVAKRDDVSAGDVRVLAPTTASKTARQLAHELAEHVARACPGREFPVVVWALADDDHHPLATHGRVHISVGGKSGRLYCRRFIAGCQCQWQSANLHIDCSAIGGIPLDAAAQQITQQLLGHVTGTAPRGIVCEPTSFAERQCGASAIVQALMQRPYVAGVDLMANSPQTCLVYTRRISCFYPHGPEVDRSGEKTVRLNRRGMYAMGEYCCLVPFNHKASISIANLSVPRKEPVESQHPNVHAVNNVCLEDFAGPLERLREQQRWADVFGLLVQLLQQCSYDMRHHLDSYTRFWCPAT